MMIDKAVIRLKNIMFFKLLFCLLTIALLSVLIYLNSQALSKDFELYEDLSSEYELALKQYSDIQEYTKHYFHHSNKIYSQIQKASLKNANKKLNHLMKQIDILSQKYYVKKPSIDSNQSIHNHFNDNLKILGSKIKLHLHIAGYKRSLAFYQALVKILPPNAAIEFVQFNKAYTLTPEIVKDLEGNILPRFVRFDIIIGVQNIIYSPIASDRENHDIITN